MRFGSSTQALLLAVCGLFFATFSYAQAPKDEAKGVPVCANCHEDKHTSIVMTAHGARNDAQGSMCQACHGDATDHLKDPAQFKPANRIKYGTASEKSAICLNCHQTNRHLAFWESGKHALNDVACTSCHDIHPKDRGTFIAPFQTTFRPNESQICGQCHKDIRSQTLKPSHHPIVEGKIKCSDCHNPHGAVSPVMLRNATVNDQCTSCHADKRGPYVFQHPPVEENCITCHNPHGSSHYKLLREHTPNLCQDCHDVARHPGTPYGGGAGFVLPDGTPNPAGVNTRFIARACVNCHSNIHGSNAPGAKGQFFLR
ncbi:MAG TPA: DmsE family decaheme c-type cytochrome [Casimicrobiaceae bacterium]|nr:DmsE family decaheme c-type cytochrome [Casimicrobiaceae bacterium]